MAHAITDGRDTPPQSAGDDLKRFTAALPKSVPVATVLGRYYAMDRDKRWERVGKAYNAIVEADGPRFPDAQAAIADAYAKKQFDEFIVPAVIGDYRGIKDGDGVLCFNFRADRVREILGAMLDPDFSGFPRKRKIKFAAAVGMAQYSRRSRQADEHDLRRRKVSRTSSARWWPNAGRTQLRMAETEKYPHVTYFLNGGREEPYTGEDRIMVPSPKVATYDLQPEMSAPELDRQGGRGDRLRQVRHDRAELRQPRHGRPHRQPARRDQGGGGRRHRLGQDRRRRSPGRAARCWSPPTTAIAN